MIHEMEGNLWVHPHDLMASIPGREDSLEDMRACAIFLGHRQRTRRSGPTHESALKTQSAIVTAHVRNSIRAPKTTDAERELDAAHKAIDRLLAFVPARAESVSSARMNAIARDLSLAVHRHFPDVASSVLTLEPEAARDTVACHRITVRALLRNMDNVDRVVDGVEAMHRELVEMTTTAELQAITLLVEPEIATQDEG